MKGKRGVLALLLALLCLLGAGCSRQAGETVSQQETAAPTASTLITPTAQISLPPEETVPPEGVTSDPAPERQTPPPSVPTPSSPPAPTPTTEGAGTCSLTVRCDVLLDRLDELDPAVAALVPEDGILFAREEISFEEGETVFDLLQRELRQAGIHLEYTSPPAYQSAYVEGIGNLYEFDCGDLSGWTYRVNGAFPGYGSSRYSLSNGDVVEWVYTCDLGRDVGWEEGG